MDPDLDHLAAAALRLPTDLRARRAERLIASPDDAVGRERREAEWNAELDRRDQALDADPSRVRPAAGMLRVARERLGGAR